MRVAIVLLRFLSATCAVASAVGAFACDVKDVRFEARSFPSEIRALAGLADSYREESARFDVEYVGAIYRADSGVFRASVARGCPGRDQFRFRIPRLADGYPTAVWHTHGSTGIGRGYFSATDAAAVDSTGLRLYLITATGELRVLDPNEPQTRVTRLPGSAVRIPGGAFPGRLVARLHP